MFIIIIFSGFKMEQFMIIKLVSITTLVFIVLAPGVSASPARSRAVVASKTANKLSPDRSGNLEKIII